MLCHLSERTLSSPNECSLLQPERGTDATVTKDKLLLIDNGGQYVDGTTDITRTVHFGTPTAQEKACFTRVLQGHIAVAAVSFKSQFPCLLCSDVNAG